ncbi:unknown protein [Parachlamydia acanthamoebae UV-7]|jgi:predicted ABC-type ATPase|uniref:Uncharacterized protein n=2 Tax=Parachlamydia acanthamoebae TaxID=83552 RepID=F8L0J2_PARAV|nr:hypothetical protein [Parachlamydia acanthamoebae]KIA77541.1 hypothetical protein DB43_GE00220 [Parachlamydia acanthamoebae]CCB86737.1 unknown protein [Parachlamydia acanthamoebae UV-7]
MYSISELRIQLIEHRRSSGVRSNTRHKELLDANKSFAFKTTGAGTNAVQSLKEVKVNSYEIHLVQLNFRKAARYLYGSGQ